MRKKITIKKSNSPVDASYVRSASREVKRPAFYLVRTSEGDVYAGSSGSVDKRISRHAADLARGEHRISKLQSCYDNDSCSIDIEIEYAKDREDAFDKEQAFVDANWNDDSLLNVARNVRCPRVGVSPSVFNIERIKETHTGKTVSSETRKKLSTANSGKVLSEERKSHLSRVNRGKRLSSETIQKISAAGTGRVTSDETRRRISEVKAGHGFPREALEAAAALRCKSVVIDGINYRSYSDAATALGTSDVTIRKRVLNPKVPNYSKSSDE